VFEYVCVSFSGGGCGGWGVFGNVCVCVWVLVWV